MIQDIDNGQKDCDANIKELADGLLVAVGAKKKSAQDHATYLREQMDVSLVSICGAVSSIGQIQKNEVAHSYFCVCDAAEFSIAAS